MTGDFTFGKQNLPRFSFLSNPRLLSPYSKCRICVLHSGPRFLSCMLGSDKADHLIVSARIISICFTSSNGVFSFKPAHNFLEVYLRPLKFYFRGSISLEEAVEKLIILECLI